MTPAQSELLAAAKDALNFWIDEIMETQPSKEKRRHVIVRLRNAITAFEKEKK